MNAKSPPDLHRRLQLPTLRILLAIADHGSFVRAAEAVSLVPSAVSRRIQDLEEVLGTPLLHRSSQAVSFTDAGRLVLERARRIVREIDGMGLDIAAFGEGARTRVRLGASIFALFEALPDDLLRFSRSHPRIEIGFQSLSTRQIMAGLARKRLDVGIFAASEVPAGLEATVYHRDQLVVLVPADHPLAGSSGVTLADIAQHDLISPPAGTETERLLADHARRGNFTLRSPIRVASPDAMILMVQAGLGLCVVPSQVWRRLGPFTAIRQIPLRENWSVRQLYVAMLAATPPAAPARRLFEHLSASALPN